MKLENITAGRNNNLNLIRFIAAILVIYSHSYPIGTGTDAGEPLMRVSGGQIGFGSLAVCVFFVFGGFLICKSMLRVRDEKTYFKARCIRIFPPLIFVAVCSAFLLGPFYTNLPLGEYFTSAGTYRYLLNGCMVLQHNLPGVFENNIYAGVVNGALWTLPVEFLCYIMCYVMYRLRLLERKNLKYTIVIFAVGCVGVQILSERGIPMVGSMIRPTVMFFIGMLYYLYQDKIKMSWKAALLAAVGLVVSTGVGVLGYMIYVFLPYLLFYLGYATKKKFAGFGKKREISYGIYLAGFPIQQMICAQFGGQMMPLVNAVLAIPLAILAGWLIWLCVENPLKK